MSNSSVLCNLIICIQVFDKDKIGKDKSLGLVTFDTAQVVKQKDIPADWYPLEGVSSGKNKINGIGKLIQ